jgi:hypothetical protein
MLLKNSQALAAWGTSSAGDAAGSEAGGGSSSVGGAWWLSKVAATGACATSVAIAAVSSLPKPRLAERHSSLQTAGTPNLLRSLQTAPR